MIDCNKLIAEASAFEKRCFPEFVAIHLGIILFYLLMSVLQISYIAVVWLKYC